MALSLLLASVNDAALHDIPGRYRLSDGDLLSIDCGATLDGWAADAAISVQVGHHRPAETPAAAAIARIRSVTCDIRRHTAAGVFRWAAWHGTVEA